MEKPDSDAAIGVRGDVAREHDAMGHAATCNGRKRDGRPDAAAVASHEADLVAKFSNRIGLKAFEGENFGVVAEHIRACEIPDPLRTGIEMRDAMRAIDDDNAFVGAFERGQQHFRSFCHGTIGGGHRWTRRHREDMAIEASAAIVSKTFLQSRRTAPRRDMIKIPQTKRR